MVAEVVAVINSQKKFRKQSKNFEKLNRKTNELYQITRKTNKTHKKQNKKDSTQKTTHKKLHTKNNTKNKQRTRCSPHTSSSRPLQRDFLAEGGRSTLRAPAAQRQPRVWKPLPHPGGCGHSRPNQGQGLRGWSLQRTVR